MVAGGKIEISREDADALLEWADRDYPDSKASAIRQLEEVARLIQRIIPRSEPELLACPACQSVVCVHPTGFVYCSFCEYRGPVDDSNGAKHNAIARAPAVLREIEEACNSARTIDFGRSFILNIIKRSRR